MEYTIKLPQSHVLFLLSMLENGAAPLKDTAPVHQNIMMNPGFFFPDGQVTRICSTDPFR